jgi:hypothetical protein
MRELRMAGHPSLTTYANVVRRRLAVESGERRRAFIPVPIRSDLTRVDSLNRRSGSLKLRTRALNFDDRTLNFHDRALVAGRTPLQTLATLCRRHCGRRQPRAASVQAEGCTLKSLPDPDP